jgi:hypothetical protein
MDELGRGIAVEEFRNGAYYFGPNSPEGSGGSVQPTTNKAEELRRYACTIGDYKAGKGARAAQDEHVLS